MCRPIYPYELGDPDFSWLLATFQESHPNFVLIDSSCLPLILVEMKPKVAGEEIPTMTVDDEFQPDVDPDEGTLEK